MGGVQRKTFSGAALEGAEGSGKSYEVEDNMRQGCRLPHFIRGSGTRPINLGVFHWYINSWPLNASVYSCQEEGNMYRFRIVVQRIQTVQTAAFARFLTCSEAIVIHVRLRLAPAHLRHRHLTAWNPCAHELLFWEIQLSNAVEKALL